MICIVLWFSLYFVLLVMSLTHPSYLFAFSLSIWTISHQLWCICLLIHLWTPFLAYLKHLRIIYKYQTHSLYIVNLFLPWNSNKYYSHLITSSLVRCKDFLGKSPLLNCTWAEPRPRTLRWVRIKTYRQRTKNPDQMLVAYTRSDT